MNRRKRNRALRGKQLVNPDNLAPRIAEGITQGVPKDEVFADLEASRQEERQIVKGMVEQAHVGRVPLPRFVGADHPTSVVLTFADGRSFRETNKTFQPETMRALQAGMICLKCLEPQSHAFGDEHLPGCEGVALAGPTYMKDRQIIDLNMEFEGEKHIGPAKPIRQYLEEMDMRAEQRAFDRKIAEGASPMKGLRRSA